MTDHPITAEVILQDGGRQPEDRRLFYAGEETTLPARCCQRGGNAHW